MELDLKMELNSLKKDMQGMQTNVEHIQGDLHGIQGQVQEIRDALLGTEFNELGLAKMVKLHEARISIIEDESISSKMYMNILKFLAGVITTGVITGILGLLIWLIKTK